MKHTYSKKILSLLLAGAMVLTGTAGVSNQTASAAAKKATIKFAKSTYSVQAGKTVTIKVTKKNVSKVKSMTWSTKDTKIAKVSKKGVVTGVKAGKTTISCKVKYKAKGAKKFATKTLKATVKVTSATVDKSNLTASNL